MQTCLNWLIGYINDQFALVNITINVNLLSNLHYIQLEPIYYARNVNILVCLVRKFKTCQMKSYILVYNVHKETKKGLPCQLSGVSFVNVFKISV